MRHRRKVTASLLGVSGVLCVANWLAGGASSETALRDLDQHILQAYARKMAVPAWQVNGFSVERRVPMPLVSYYEGQSLVASREISCAERKSVVVWYGGGAVVAWQEGVWFPDRPAVIERVVETGHLR